MIERIPKPGEIKARPAAVGVMKDGREVCNLNTKAGRDEYERRKLQMRDRQGGKCMICGQRLSVAESTFDHETGRGMGGGHRDDRIEVHGKPQNAALHFWCNAKKGSVRGYGAETFHREFGGEIVP